MHGGRARSMQLRRRMLPVAACSKAWLAGCTRVQPACGSLECCQLYVSLFAVPCTRRCAPVVCRQYEMKDLHSVKLLCGMLVQQELNGVMCDAMEWSLGQAR
jgi:hypothetical protein